jgi:hypothetical protein
MMLNFLENLISIITEHETFMGAYPFMYRNSDPSAWNAHGYVPCINEKCRYSNGFVSMKNVDTVMDLYQ